MAAALAALAALPLLPAAPLAAQSAPAPQSTPAQEAAARAWRKPQLATNDAIVPGSALLGYVNADHWAIAIALSRQLPLLRGLFVDDVPRAALALAAITVIHQQASHPRP